MNTVENIYKAAKEASRELCKVNFHDRNAALINIARALNDNKAKIEEANDRDLKRSMEDNLPMPLLKRLEFKANKIVDIVKGLESMVLLPDPLGKLILKTNIDDDLVLTRVSCPIGVIGVIFESRPDALVQISSLCLKSGNSVILKGGSEAKETNKVLADIIIDATKKIAGIPDHWIHLIEKRDDVSNLLLMDEYVDLIIPRGSNGFIKYIMQNTNIPVMGHAAGLCHLYIDKAADIEMAVNIAVDSKTQYVAVCNAIETILVHRDVAQSFLPILKEAMDQKNTMLKGCNRTREIIKCEAASEEDWDMEYLDYILAVKVVDGLDEAVEHINKHGSGHTDSIVTADRESAEKFMDLVDSAGTYWNCSTRFADGFVYGFGAEVGISTGKLHSRGPVGLEGLTSYKYKLVGNGNIIDDYNKANKTYKHKSVEL